MDTVTIISIIIAVIGILLTIYYGIKSSSYKWKVRNLIEKFE